MHSRLTRTLCVQAAVLSALRAAGFASARVLVPHAMPLRALAKTLSSCALLLTAHGSGMFNQVCISRCST